MGQQLMPYDDFIRTPQFKKLRNDMYENDPRVLAWMMWRNMHVRGVLDYSKLSPEVLRLWQEKERAVVLFQNRASTLWRELSDEQATEPTLIWDGELDDEH